jgi:hypothetical protein
MHHQRERRYPFDPRSQATLGPVSTWMGDSLGPYTYRLTDFEPAVWADGEVGREIWRLCPFGIGSVSCQLHGKTLLNCWKAKEYQTKGRAIYIFKMGIKK